MSATTQRPAAIVADRDYPSPVVRVVALGFYDGPTDGVLQTADGRAYRFDMVAEDHNPDGLDDRTFVLRPLPAGAFDAVAELIGAAAAAVVVPRWPAAAGRKADIDHVLDTILDSALAPAWEVRCRDLTGTITATPAP